MQAPNTAGYGWLARPLPEFHFRAPRTAARIVEVGRAAWKAEACYHRRSLAETAMSRYKALIGPRLPSRAFDRQKVEAAIAVHCINRFTALGMPVSVRIA